MKAFAPLKLPFVIFVFSLIFLSCKRDDIQQPDPSDKDKDITQLDIPEEFNFETSHTVSLDIKTLNARYEAVPAVRVDVYLADPEDETAEGRKIFSARSDKNGVLQAEISVPDYIGSLYVGTDYIGYPNAVELEITGQKIVYSFGVRNEVQILKSIKPVDQGNSFKSVAYQPVYKYMGGYNYNGMPDYLIEPDVISPDFYDDLNATFPENRPVPQYHPEYLDDSYVHNLILDQPADVWVTFVHEGAGYKNSFGYYKYLLGNAPQQAQDVDTVTIIFPNASFQGSGGDLQSGDKVYLGQFPANTVIGWVLVADGYSLSQQQVTGGKHIVYSDPAINPETNPQLWQHAVLLNDNGRDLFVLGFEDLRRDGWCDNDFNDAMFYVTANPIVAVETENLGIIEYTDSDADNDGVSDSFDDYPNDPEKAFDNFYPDANSYGTLAFEDLWPSRGDYDFNDMVLDYRFLQVLNGENEMVELQAEFVLKAFGASNHNGFAFEMPFSPSLIQSINGQVITEDYVSLAPNNTEAGMAKSVVFVFDNAYKVMDFPGGGTGVNTDPLAPYVAPETISLQIVLTQPIALSDAGTPPFNPFIVVNRNRGREVHLPDKAPTSHADLSLFGTSSDDSNPSTGRYYKTSTNLPWALNIIDQFDYPIERASVIDGHLKFADWAESGGQNFYDWFQDQGSYRDNSKLYSSPQRK